jgi:hypothetical protein
MMAPYSSTDFVHLAELYSSLTPDALESMPILAASARIGFHRILSLMTVMNQSPSLAEGKNVPHDRTRCLCY